MSSLLELQTGESEAARVNTGASKHTSIASLDVEVYLPPTMLVTDEATLRFATKPVLGRAYSTKVGTIGKISHVTMPSTHITPDSFQVLRVDIQVGFDERRNHPPLFSPIAHRTGSHREHISGAKGLPQRQSSQLPVPLLHVSTWTGAVSTARSEWRPGQRNMAKPAGSEVSWSGHTRRSPKGLPDLYPALE